MNHFLRTLDGIPSLITWKETPFLTGISYFVNYVAAKTFVFINALKINYNKNRLVEITWMWLVTELGDLMDEYLGDYISCKIYNSLYAGLRVIKSLQFTFPVFSGIAFFLSFARASDYYLLCLSIKGEKRKDKYRKKNLKAPTAFCYKFWCIRGALSIGKENVKKVLLQLP